MITSRAYLLLEEFESGENVCCGIANVLKFIASNYVAYSDCEGGSLVGVPVATLDDLADELEAGQ